MTRDPDKTSAKPNLAHSEAFGASIVVTRARSRITLGDGLFCLPFHTSIFTDRSLAPTLPNCRMQVQILALVVTATAFSAAWYIRSRRRRSTIVPVPAVSSNRLRRQNLRTLPRDTVPERLKNSFYFDLDCARERGGLCAATAQFLLYTHDVGAALDELHTHVTATLSAHRDAWHSKSSSTKTIAAPSRHHGGICIGHVAVLLDRPAEFVPERLIGSAAAAPGAAPSSRVPLIMVEEGVCVQGGTLDASGGDIYLGARVVVEPGALFPNSPCAWSPISDSPGPLIASLHADCSGWSLECMLIAPISETPGLRFPRIASFIRCAHPRSLRDRRGLRPPAWGIPARRRAAGAGVRSGLRDEARACARGRRAAPPRLCGR